MHPTSLLLRARPLRRFIEQTLGTEIARALMEGGLSLHNQGRGALKTHPIINVDYNTTTGGLGIAISFEDKNPAPSSTAESESSEEGEEECSGRSCVSDF